MSRLPPRTLGMGRVHAHNPQAEVPGPPHIHMIQTHATCFSPLRNPVKNSSSLLCQTRRQV